MGRFTPKHPQDLTQLVGNAVANGLKPPDVQRQLAAGTFPGWRNPYDMPLETVRYYGRQEKRQRARKTVTTEALQNPKREVDRLARLLLSAAQMGLEQARPDIDSDPKALKEWGDALKTINQLVSDTAQDDTDKPSRAKVKAAKPTDPLSARLLAAETPSPHQEDTTQRDGTQQERDTAPTTTPPTNTPHQPHHTSGVPAAAPDRPVQAA